MKEILGPMVQQALKGAFESGDLQPGAELPSVLFEIPKVAAHGDFSTNVAMTMASAQKRAPREIAQIIIDHMEDSDSTLLKTEIAGPGFINFFIRDSLWFDILKAVHPEAYVPETEYQKGLKQNISQIQDELNRVVEASIAGDDLPDIPVVRELKEQQAIAIKEARQSALTQVSDEINQLQDELAKIKEQNYDTFNNKFKTPKISYDEARRGKLSPEIEYNQKAQQLKHFDVKIFY